MGKILILFLVSILLVISMFTFVSSEEIDLGGYDVEKVDEPVIITPEEIEKPSEEEFAPRISSKSSSSSNIADNYLINKLGNSYFSENFEFIEIKEEKFVSFYKYNFKYGKYVSEVFLAVSGEQIMEELSNIPLKSIKIIFNGEDALDKAKSLNLPEPQKISLVYSNKDETFAWRVDWEHEPSLEEMQDNVISGYLFDSQNGDILRTVNFEIGPKKINNNIEGDASSLSYVNYILLFFVVLFILIIIIKAYRK